MSTSLQKKNRVLDIFYRAFRGENISVKELADEYNVSTKSISRDINEIKNFLSDNRDLVGNSELEYSHQEKVYQLRFDGFLLSKELVAMLKILIGSRALSKEELSDIVYKLKGFTTYNDRIMLEKLIQKEMYHYEEVGRDCESVVDNIWQLTNCISSGREISISYMKMNRDEVEHRIKPLAIIFSENYFYLFAADEDKNKPFPMYLRVDRIKNITLHRDSVIDMTRYNFDEGELRKRIQYMFPGEEMTIRFEFSGPSVQAILDRMPTARIIEKHKDKYIIEAVVYGDGIKMYLLSQGSHVKVISPPSFVESMKQEVDKLYWKYME